MCWIEKPVENLRELACEEESVSQQSIPRARRRRIPRKTRLGRQFKFSRWFSSKEQRKLLGMYRRRSRKCLRGKQRETSRNIVILQAVWEFESGLVEKNRRGQAAVIGDKRKKSVGADLRKKKNTSGDRRKASNSQKMNEYFFSDSKEKKKSFSD